MEGFLWGLLATALLGVAVAAWQKPDFFLKYIAPWLSKLTTGAAVLAGVWQYSSSYTRSAVIKVIPDLSMEMLTTIQDVAVMPFSVWVGIIGFSVYQGVMSMIAWALLKHSSQQVP